MAVLKYNEGDVKKVYNKTINITESFDIGQMANFVADSFINQGFDIDTVIEDNYNITFIIKKDRKGFKNIIGLGVESKVRIIIYQNSTANIIIDDVWSNKIIPIAVGLFFALLIIAIPGMYGTYQQYKMKDKIISEIKKYEGVRI